MKSTKSSLPLRERTRPRLSRTLAKKDVFFYDLSKEHLPYLWAGYKKGAFKDPVFREGMDKEEFVNVLSEDLDSNNLSAIVFTHKNETEKVIGVGFFWARGRILETADLVWFPWATEKQILRSYLNFLNEIRQMKHESGMNFMVLEYAQEKDEKYFNHICKYGVMRRLGTSHEIEPGKKTCIYETRSLNA